MKSAVLNLFFLSGLGSLCVGLWWWAPWVALVVGGALAMGLAVLGHWGSK